MSNEIFVCSICGEDREAHEKAMVNGANYCRLCWSTYQSWRRTQIADGELHGVADYRVWRKYRGLPVPMYKVKQGGPAKERWECKGCGTSVETLYKGFECCNACAQLHRRWEAIEPRLNLKTFLMLQEAGRLTEGLNEPLLSQEWKAGLPVAVKMFLDQQDSLRMEATQRLMEQERIKYTYETEAEDMSGEDTESYVPGIPKQRNDD